MNNNSTQVSRRRFLAGAAAAAGAFTIVPRSVLGGAKFVPPSEMINIGKHVYCEKPLTHNISEARLIAKAAKEAGVATQMGNQGRSSEGNRLTCEWVWAGLIGDVREVHSWSGAGGWSSGADPT